MSYSKILLVILPIFWPKMVPIGLGYLESFLKKNNIQADILDLNNIFYNLVSGNLKKEWLVSCGVFLEKNILQIIERDYPRQYHASIEKMLNYDIVGFSCFKSNFGSTLTVAKFLKSKCKDVKIILGGPEITRQFFKKGPQFDNRIIKVSDFLVVGEGEKPLHEYIASRKKTKRIAKFEELDNLNDISFPTYRSLNLNTYPRKDAIPLQFSRGCIRKCSFCSERLLYKSFRTRCTGDIIDEIKYHKEHHKTNYFVFFDSLINADLRRLEDLCDRIIEQFGSINWEAQIAIRNDMQDRVFEKMKRSGCFNLFVGLESGSDNILKNMNKGFTAKEAGGFLKRLNKAGLSFGISIIVGYPGESDLDFKETLDFIVKNKDIIPKIEQVNPFVWYDGTDADKSADYKIDKNSLKRMEIFIKEIKRYNFKYTNAFIGNLIEKNGRI